MGFASLNDKFWMISKTSIFGPNTMVSHRISLDQTPEGEGQYQIITKLSSCCSRLNMTAIPATFFWDVNYKVQGFYCDVDTFIF